MLRFYFVFFTVFTSLLFADSKPKLTDYKKNVFSERGEDGVIDKIFQVIGTTSKIVVEFGAWDGFCSSNTANLWSKDSTWKGVLIEGDKRRYDQLIKKTAQYRNCKTFHKFIEASGKNSLESLLKDAKIGNKIDLLSIDVDSNDGYIFQSLDKLRPRVIVIEYNPTIPASVDIQTADMGSSVAAHERVGREKGYSLVALTDWNCFFVRNDLFPLFAGFDTDREHLRVDRYLRYVITDFKGRYTTVGSEDFYPSFGTNSPYPDGEIKKWKGKYKTVPLAIK